MTYFDSGSFNAGRIEILLAKIFGKKHVEIGDKCDIVGYHYKGKTYITSIDFKD